MTTASEQSLGRTLLFGTGVGVVATALMISIFSVGFHPLQADETVLALGAKRILSGSVLYRDIYAHMPPVGFYLIAFWYRLFGVSLASLRVLSIIIMSLGTVILFGVLRRAGAPNPWAAIGALAFAGIAVTVWPVPSHHYFALVLGFAALLVAGGRCPTPVSWFIAAILVGFAGMALQTEGVIFAILLAARMATDPRARRPINIVTASIGLALPVLAFAALFAARGALGDAVYHLVVWPGRYYKQPGGFNDTIGEGFKGLQIGAQGVRVPSVQLVSAYWLLGAPLLLSLCLVIDVMKEGRARDERVGRLGALIATLAVWLVFLQGRIDAIHLIAFSVPVFIYLLIARVRWDSASFMSRAVKAWLLVCFVLLALQWGGRWRSDPPSVRAVLAVDSTVQHDRVAPIIDGLPGVRAGGLPVLHLSYEATTLYFYWGPVVPPSTWLLPPSVPYNSPEDYTTFVTAAQQSKVPWIVLQPELASRWESDPSPIRDLLRSSYRRVGSMPWGTVYERTPASPTEATSD